MPAMGTILAALALALAGQLEHKGRLFLGTASVVALGLVAFAASRSFGLSLGVLVIVGAAGTATMALGNTLLQQIVTDRLRGRVMGFWMACTQGVGTLGALPTGVVAELWSAPFALTVNAALLLLVLLGLAASRGGIRDLS
jgi:hypothetical protein